ncbi:uncharacterized protein LOC131859829 [Cryptomeria japonica]|uniref:uncharacterized protein LOC131859829 n=1 Tax=Cryptomeria japonica TaxID=3369 RepID=UPI0027D9DD90|nr:uncharacterized protein LOC131859829 [Cryptomeria japonica]
MAVDKYSAPNNTVKRPPQKAFKEIEDEYILEVIPVGTLAAVPAAMPSMDIDSSNVNCDIEAYLNSNKIVSGINKYNLRHCSNLERWLCNISTWKNLLQTIGQKRAKDYRFVEKQLNTNLQIAESNIQDNPADLDRLSHVMVAKDALRIHQQIKIRGAKIRSRAHWLQVGDRGSKFFFNLLKHKHCKEAIDKLSIDNQDVSDPYAISNAFADFYKILFSSEDSLEAEVCRDKCKALIPGKLDSKDISNLSKSISIVEVEAAVKALSNDKAPGPDGFPVEFYKSNLSWISKDLLDLYNEAISNGSLGPDINQGIIKLLPKDGNKALIKNWRPITLLNVSYKVLAKILALRLVDILPKFIGPSQTGFIKGRYILENLITSWEAMDWAKNSHQNTAMLLLDFEKAYDKVEWKFILMMLEAFGFPPYFCLAVQTLLKDASAHIEVNGVLSPSFPLGRSIRQGCPLAPALFVIASEALYYILRDSSLSLEVRGIFLPNDEELINCQFADDTALFFELTKNNFKNLQGKLDVFCSASGARISHAKSICLGWDEHPLSGLLIPDFNGEALTKLSNILVSPFLWSLPLRICGSGLKRRFSISLINGIIELFLWLAGFKSVRKFCLLTVFIILQLGCSVIIRFKKFKVPSEPFSGLMVKETKSSMLLNGPGSVVFKSIWKAWEHVRDHISNKDYYFNDQLHGERSIWWNLVINGKPLALSQGCSARSWAKKGISQFVDLFEDGLLPSWDTIKTKYDIPDSQKKTYNMILQAARDLPSLCHVDSLRHLNCKWSGGVVMASLKAKNIYSVINQTNDIIVHVNSIWYSSFDTKMWNKLFQYLWRSPIEPKINCFKWLVLLDKLPVKSFNSDSDLCSICRLPETGRHILFDCLFAKEIWSMFGVIYPITVSILDMIIGYISGLPKDSNLFWNILSSNILWQIWKCRNEEKYQGKPRALIEFFRKLTYFKIFLQVQVTMMIERKKLERFLKTGHTSFYYYELKNGYLWRRTLEDLHAFDQACDKLRKEIRKNANPRMEELSLLSQVQAHKNIIWMEGPQGWTAWVDDFYDILH